MLSTPLASTPLHSTMPPPAANATERGLTLPPLMLQRGIPVAASSASALALPPSAPTDTVSPDTASETTPPICRRHTSSGDRSDGAGGTTVTIDPGATEVPPP